MNFEEAINLLRVSELKQLSLKNSDEDVMGYINFGILELHKRFVLRQTEAVVTIVDNVNTYTLDGIDTNVAIDLTNSVFLKINDIVNQNNDIIILNNEYDDTGVVTPTGNTLKLSKNFDRTEHTSLTVSCRTAPSFKTDVYDNIDLPPQLWEALFHYVGYRAHGSISGDIKFENNTHYVRFDKSCRQVKIEGLYESDSLQSNKFNQSVFSLVGL